MQEEDRINYSKQIKSAQRGLDRGGWRKGRLRRFPMASTAQPGGGRRSPGAGINLSAALQRPPEATQDTQPGPRW